MTDGDALLKAILADPADDTARLVYADWLDENGHAARAEFIRLQVGLAHCDDPNGYCNCGREECRWCPLYWRERELLAAHRREWLGGPECGACGGKRTRTTRWRIAEMNADDYGESTSTCDDCRGTGYECWPLVEMTHGRFGSVVGSVENIRSHFTRGFVSRVELTAAQFTDEVAKVIFRHHPVTTVVVRDVHIEDATWNEDHVFTRGQIVYGVSILSQPRQVWKYITGFVPTYPDDDSVLKWFATREEALVAFYAGAAAWGRELAGLPRLTPGT